VLADKAPTGRSTAYHYFHKETGGSARGGGASWRGAACYTAVADIKKKLCRRDDRFGTESSPHAKQLLLHCRRRGSDPRRQWKIEWAKGRACSHRPAEGKINMTEEMDGVDTDRRTVVRRYIRQGELGGSDQ